jgi:branched-chain amino acid transport system ATP-binding protein
MLKVKAVDKYFDGFKAVNGANLEVQSGEFVAVIGPNGAGKTTLLNIITGQLKPENGRIIFKGEDITGLSPHQICKKRISRSFQTANIFPRLTVFENVQVAVLSQQRQNFNFLTPSNKLAVKETSNILETVGLLGEANSLSGALSYGDQRILEIAIALGNEPELLILDEPTAGMSENETIAMLKLIKQLVESRGLTVLFCEHNMNVVFSAAQKIMVMHQGRSVIQGNPDEVRKNKEVQDAYLGENELCSK